MNSAKRTFIAVMGAWMGLAGVEHGMGEILQGNVIPDGLMIYSWPDSAFFHALNGEPAMTILPNMLVTGILAIIFSLLFASGCIFFAFHKRMRLVLFLLPVLMLLFGGGIFPPFLGFLMAIAVVVLDSHGAPGPVNGIRSWIGRGWSWFFAACIVAWLMLLPGVAAAGYLFGEVQDGIILSVMGLAFMMLFLSGWSSSLHDRLFTPKTGID